MPLRSTTAPESDKGVPSREGQAPTDAGVGCGWGTIPTPALRVTPPTEGIIRGDAVIAGATNKRVVFILAPFLTVSLVSGSPAVGITLRRAFD
jgi:hypothetical protein